MLLEIEYIYATQQLHRVEALESTCGGEENINDKLNSKKIGRVRNIVNKYVKYIKIKECGSFLFHY